MENIVAITEWNGIVSPLYDSACRLRVIRMDGTNVQRDISGLTLAGKVDLCVNEGVTVLICGAISTLAQSLLEERSIMSLSWVCGPVEEVIDSWRKGIDVRIAFAMPGSSCGVGGLKRRMACKRHGRHGYR